MLAYINLFLKNDEAAVYYTAYCIVNIQLMHVHQLNNSDYKTLLINLFNLRLNLGLIYGAVSRRGARQK